MMDDLVTWLRAQLDEDERVARAVGAEAWREATEPGNFNEWNPTEIGHVLRQAPSRVLAEVEAKRRILDHLAYNINGEPLVLVCDEACECGPDGGSTCWLVRLLALPYADQPGYREEWRPA